MRNLVTMVVAVAALVLLASCTPTVTITAKPAKTKATCWENVRVEGIVTPKDATSRVVLQRTEGGKWVDWLWYNTGESEEVPHRIAGDVQRFEGQNGEYSLDFNTPWWATTLHLRVRSNGGSVVSPGFYVTSSGTNCRPK